MKYHIAFKFLALVLAALGLTTALFCAAGTLAMGSMGLYNADGEELVREQEMFLCRKIGRYLAQQYALDQLSGCPADLLENAAEYDASQPEPLVRLEELEPDLAEMLQSDGLYYALEGADGEILTVGGSFSGSLSQRQRFSFPYEISYPVLVGQSPVSLDAAAGPAPEEYDWKFTHWDTETTGTTYFLTTGGVLDCTVTLYPEASALEDALASSPENQLLLWFLQYRYLVPAGIPLGLLLFAVLFVYLCCSAGRRPGAVQVEPQGLNRFPLDLYALAVALYGMIFVTACGWLWERIDWLTQMPPALVAVFSGLYGLCLGLTGMFFALAAQAKAGGGRWWRWSLTGRCLGLLWHLVKLAAGLLWHMVRLAGRCLGRIYGLLPLVWQWVLAGLAMLAAAVLVPLVQPMTALVFLVLSGSLVLYGAYAFGKLLESAGRMSAGDLEAKVDSRFLAGSFRVFAQRLNDLAGVAVQAARKQMKSERMKAELVTNVSHDIKTPLTSIINYVDLMQKAQSPEEAEGYLEVLSRQSQRLKKLIEDLMELSKASTGNLPVEIRRMDAAEAVRQALGEFSEKLETAGLTPVCRFPEAPVPMLADGRLCWRVLSNLLSNAVKYALPGTRVYVDLVSLDGNVLISVKNISREPLNVSAEELMERFVRGDASRNTEGSGLGLNIARSLMELQQGRLELLIDGDLFKAILIFPGA